MKTLKTFLFVILILSINVAFAQQKEQLPSADELNILKRFAPYLDIFLGLGVAYQLYLYFMDFQTEKAFLKMIPIAFSVFIAFHWRTILGWIGVFGY